MQGDLLAIVKANERACKPAHSELWHSVLPSDSITRAPKPDQRLALGRGPRDPDPDYRQHHVGSSVWGGGPTAVLVYMNGPIVAGALASNVWSFDGTHGPGGMRGERKGENVVGAVPTGTVGTGDRSGFQTTGRMVR